MHHKIQPNKTKPNCRPPVQCALQTDDPLKKRYPELGSRFGDQESLEDPFDAITRRFTWIRSDSTLLRSNLGIK